MSELLAHLKTQLPANAQVLSDVTFSVIEEPVTIDLLVLQADRLLAVTMLDYYGQICAPRVDIEDPFVPLVRVGRLKGLKPNPVVQALTQAEKLQAYLQQSAVSTAVLGDSRLASMLTVTPVLWFTHPRAEFMLPPQDVVTVVSSDTESTILALPEVHFPNQFTLHADEISRLARYLQGQPVEDDILPEVEEADDTLFAEIIAAGVEPLTEEALAELAILAEEMPDWMPTEPASWEVTDEQEALLTLPDVDVEATWVHEPAVSLGRPTAVLAKAPVAVESIPQVKSTHTRPSSSHSMMSRLFNPLVKLVNGAEAGATRLFEAPFTGQQSMNAMQLLHLAEEQMEQTRQVLLEATLVHNVYHIFLATEDYKLVSPLKARVEQDVRTHLHALAQARGYELLGNLVVMVVVDEQETTAVGEARIQSHFDAEAEAPPEIMDKADNPANQPARTMPAIYALYEPRTGHRFSLTNGHLTIGRHTENDVSLAHLPRQHIRLVSKWHAHLCAEDNQLTLFDGVNGQASTNGTYVNGQRIGPQGHLLKEGDIITLGQLTRGTGRTRHDSLTLQVVLPQ